MRKCFLDLDGVLSDFVGGCSLKFNKPCPFSNPEHRGEETWGSLPGAYGVSEEDFWESLDYEFWRNLPKTREFPWIKSIAETHFDGQVYLLTSPCRTPGCVDGKLEWIEEHLGKQYRRKTLVGNAKEACASRDSILVDDNTENCHRFIEHGGRAFLVPRPWNSHHKREAVLVRDLEEFCIATKA